MSTPRIHELKCWPVYFNPLAAGRKTVEIRKDDRDYRDGDILEIHEWDPREECYTGNAIRLEVSHILRDRPFVPEGYVAMSVRRPVGGKDHRGLYRKYRVMGGPGFYWEIPGPYFVLRPEKDMAARAAIRAYAEATESAALRSDLLRVLEDLEEASADA